MLFIWDIHITARYKDNIIEQLDLVLENNPEEKNIIFLGDFVYHFSYDRASLLALYELFLRWYAKGKNIYILAGNHDRLGQYFVYEEAQKAFDILAKINPDQDGGNWKLFFITEPQIHKIEWETVFFMPYVLDAKPYIADSKTFSSLQEQKIHMTAQKLQESSNQHERHSGYVNQVMLEYIQQNKPSLVIHHYYTHNTNFPGQKAKFNYKDIALCESFLDFSELKMISGHLHQPFTYKNYLCTGSVWSTSPLEINQVKWIFKYLPEDKKIIMDVIYINPYIHIDIQSSPQITEEQFNKQLLAVQEECFSYLEKDFAWYTLEINNSSQVITKNISLSLQVEQVDYENIQTFVDPELYSSLRDVKLKKQTASPQDIKKHLDLVDKNLTAGFSDRKAILKSYLQNKYPSEYENYEKKLKELKLL